MTNDEEEAFRQTARRALQQSPNIVLVFTENPGEGEIFSLVAFPGRPFVGILIPETWEHEAGIEDRCHAILRQESKALGGLALD